MKYLKVSNIKLNIDATNEDAIKEALSIAGLNVDEVIEKEIIKLSIDARKKPDIKKIFSVGILIDTDYSSKNDKVVVLDEKQTYK